jgi:hypothetical protein
VSGVDKPDIRSVINYGTLESSLSICLSLSLSIRTLGGRTDIHVLSSQGDTMFNGCCKGSAGGKGLPSEAIAELIFDYDIAASSDGSYRYGVGAAHMDCP